MYLGIYSNALRLYFIFSEIDNTKCYGYFQADMSGNN